MAHDAATVDIIATTPIIATVWGLLPFTTCNKMQIPMLMLAAPATMNLLNCETRPMIKKCITIAIATTIHTIAKMNRRIFFRISTKVVITT